MEERDQGDVCRVSAGENFFAVYLMLESRFGIIVTDKKRPTREQKQGEADHKVRMKQIVLFKYLGLSILLRIIVICYAHPF